MNTRNCLFGGRNVARCIAYAALRPFRLLRRGTSLSTVKAHKRARHLCKLLRSRERGKSNHGLRFAILGKHVNSTPNRRSKHDEELGRKSDGGDNCEGHLKRSTHANGLEAHEEGRVVLEE